MKKFLFITLLCSLFAGCKKEEIKEEPINIIGSWHLTELHQIKTRSVTIGKETVDVYINFTADYTFQLYQMIGNGKYRHYFGSWSITDDKLTGVYNDNTAWGTTYNVELNTASTELTLTAGEEQYVYTKKDIPSSILSDSK